MRQGPLVTLWCMDNAPSGYTSHRSGKYKWVCATCGLPSKAVYLQVTGSNQTSSEGHQTAMATSSTKTFDIEAFLVDLRELIDTHVGNGKAISTPAPAKSRAKPSKAVEPDEDEADEDEREAELNGMGIPALKKIAKGLGFTPADLADASKEDLIFTILEEERENGGADDEADEEDVEDDEAEDEDDEGGEYTRDDLIGLDLRGLKKIARDEFDETTDSLRGLDKEDVIAIILGESEDDEDEEDEDDEDESDDEGDEITEEYLQGLSLAQLRAEYKAFFGEPAPRGMKQDAMIDAFFAE